jgi:carboxyl-terminal processing protease
MGSKKLQVWLPVLFSLAIVLGMLIGYQLRDETSGGRFLGFSKRTSLQEVVDLVKSRYVDKVASDSINQLAVNQLLSHLDPHSILIPSDQLNAAEEHLQDNIKGIGIEFQVFDDTVNVMNVIKTGPSEKAGIEVGDKLIAINDTAQIAGKFLRVERLRSLLKGETGTKVKIKILRSGKVIEKIVERASFPVPIIDVSYMLDKETGFLRINRFADRSYEAFMESMGDLKKKGMQKLILDLRGNGGGLLKEAIAIADEFLSGDKLIVYTEGDHQQRVDSRCRRDGIFEVGKLVVLVDEGSASASEVLAGALQDWDRATIIGRRTFGKGLVQQQFQLSDGSAVRLTIARYYTPLGRNIQKPYGKDHQEYNEEVLARFHSGSMIKEDTSKPKGKAFKTPSGKLVYDGGGISPDIFIPLDTSNISDNVMRLYYRNSLSSFVYRYYLQNRTRFDLISKPDNILTDFQPGEKELMELRSFALSHDGVIINTFTEKEKTQISQRLQTLMAKQLWRMEGYFEIANRYDAAVQKGVLSLK